MKLFFRGFRSDTWKWATLAILISLPWIVLANEESAQLAKARLLAAANKNPSPLAADADVAIELADTEVEELGSRTNLPYLGVATKEVSEALGAQLGLQDGAGLVVTFVAPDSPAAKAGLQKHDVLVRLGEQTLVHPAQLRKLVHVHKPDDAIELVFYRSGKQTNASVTLVSAPARASLFPGSQKWDEEFQEENRSPEVVIHNSLKRLGRDRKEIHQEVHRSMEEVREAIKEALRDLTNVASNLDPVRNVLREINRSVVNVDKKATVTVRSAGKGSKSVVKTDDSGTIVLVQNPKIHLTAHDKEGHLLFDGEIETLEQREKVSRDVWEKVEPLLERMTSGKD
jgi:hypothetical protein